MTLQNYPLHHPHFILYGFLLEFLQILFKWKSFTILLLVLTGIVLWRGDEDAICRENKIKQKHCEHTKTHCHLDLYSKVVKVDRKKILQGQPILTSKKQHFCDIYSDRWPQTRYAFGVSDCLKQGKNISCYHLSQQISPILECNFYSGWCFPGILMLPWGVWGLYSIIKLAVFAVDHGITF